MTSGRPRGARQKAFRQRQKDKQQTLELQLQELSERVSELQLERDQLQRAVEVVTRNMQCAAPASQPGIGDQRPSGDDEIALTFFFGETAAQLQLTQGEVRALSAKAMAEIWKMLVQKLALSLDKLNAYPKDPGLRQKVEDLVHEAHLLLWAVGERKPRKLPLSTCAMVASDAPRNWQAILVYMQLTQGQAQQLLACRRTMLREVGALIAEWDRLWKELESFKGVEEKGHGLVTHHLQTAAITEQLRVNVHSLYTCTAFYQSYACTKVLSPVQFARYLVVSYPWGPDTLSLMTCLAQHCGERSTGELLRMARPGAAAGAGAAPGAPFCPAGDWRQALAQPLCVLHGKASSSS